MSAPPPVGDDPPSRPDETSGLPEDIWDRFLRDTEQRIRSSAPREPSAAERLSADGPQVRRLPVPPPITPRAGGATRPADGRARGPLGTLLVVTVVVLLGVLTLNPALVASWAREVTGGHRRAPAGVPSAAHPFAGTPAEHWADGADGIAVPPARAVGSMTSAQVAAALLETKRYLIASDIDPRTLRGRWPSGVIGLIDPRDTAQTAALTRALRSPDAAHDPLRYVTRYDSARLRPAGAVVKVRGAMTFAAGERGSVEVRADVSFVYPFTRARAGSSEVSSSVVRRVAVTRMYAAGASGTTPGRLWLARTDGYRFNDSCGVADGYLHPRFASDEPSAWEETGRAATATAAPYDRRTAVAGLPRCQS